jgi:hypothetical protein
LSCRFGWPPALLITSAVVAMLALTALFEVLPYLEELIRGLRYREWRAKD